MNNNYYRPQTIRALSAGIALALSLGLTSCKSPAAPADDAALSASVQSRISGDGALSSESIQSSVQNGVATLTGTVTSDAARSLAAADAAQIAGIKTVVNDLVVRPVTAAAAVVAPRPAPVPRLPRTVQLPKSKPAPIVRQPEPAQQEAQVTPPPAPTPHQEPPPPAPEAPVPAFRDITIPAGTVLPVRINQTLDSATTQQGDTFTGTVAANIILDNLTVLREGTPVAGRVSAVQEAAHYKGNSLLTVELTSINRRGERLPITTEPYSVQGKGRGKNTAEKVGGGAAVGAILGGIFGGGKGAAIGAAAGGGVGAGANTVTRGEQVQIQSESMIRFQLNDAVPLRVSTKSPEAPASGSDLQQRPQDQPPQ